MKAAARRGSVLINDIWISPSRRPVDASAVSRLAESIRDIGLLTPITVRVAAKVIDPEDGEISDVTALVAGRHRLEAMKSLGYDQIDCFFADYDDLHAELAEIDENLMRGNLTPAQEAVVVSRRKEIYESLHPETRNGAARWDQNDKMSFSSATAEATGKDKRTVERAAARGKALGEDLEGVAGTSLDKGSELDALVKMVKTDEGKSEAKELIKRAKAGEKVSARSVKIDGDVKRRADEAAAEILIEDLSHGRLEAFVSHLFTAGHKSLAMTLRNKLGETIMDRRYA